MRRVSLRVGPLVLLAVAGALALVLVLRPSSDPGPTSAPGSQASSSSSPATEPGALRVGSPTRVVLNPTTSPESSQSFSWTAGRAEESGRVEIAPAEGGATEDVEATPAGTVNGNPHQHFSATVSELEPATPYRYRVGSPGGWSPWHEFSTADPDQEDFTFLYFGDAQVGLDTTWPRVVAAADARAPDAVGAVHAGDLINNADVDAQWENWFTGLGSTAATSNVFAVPGNHEHLGDSLLRVWRTTFEFPRNSPTRETIGSLAELAEGDDEVARQYAAFFDRFTELAVESVYYTDYQGVRFVALDATRDQTFLNPEDLPRCVDPQCPASSPGELWIRFQAAWLDGVLADSEATWDVVTFHQPVYSSSVGRDEPFVREHLGPVLENRDVDLVLMGHDHVYARGFKDSDATGTPGLTSGPVYVTTNSGAQHFALETGPDKNVWTANGATQVRTGQGVTTYQTVDVTGASLHYRSWLVEKGKKTDSGLTSGSLFDEFTVTRSEDGRTWVTEPGVSPPD